MPSPGFTDAEREALTRARAARDGPSPVKGVPRRIADVEPSFTSASEARSSADRQENGTAAGMTTRPMIVGRHPVTLKARLLFCPYGNGTIVGDELYALRLADDSACGVL
jgi:hypothetical protein